MVNHPEFVEDYKAGRVRIHVDRSLALQVAKSNLIAVRYRAAHWFWTLVWFFSFPAGIALVIWYKWWVGIAIIVVAFFMPPAISRSAAQFVLEQSLEDEVFFKKMIEKQVITISEVKK